MSMSARRRAWWAVGSVLGLVAVAGVVILLLSGNAADDVTAEASTVGSGSTGAPQPSPSGADEDGDRSATSSPRAAEPGPEPAATERPVPDGVDPAAPPAALDEPATFTSGVVARLLEIEPVDGEAQGPGEVAGPALRVVVELENRTEDAVDLTAVVVNVYAGAEGRPGEPLAGPDAEPLEGELEPGGRAVGAYVFAVPVELQGDVQVTVSYDATVPAVLLEGRASE